MLQENYWTVALDSVKLGDQSITEATKAIIDTGTSLITGPTKEVEKLVEMLGAKPIIKGEYSIDCDKPHPNISFVFNQNKYELTSDEYVIKNGGKCILGVMSLDTPENFWIMGDIFIRKYYTIFDMDNKRVGLANKKL